MKNQARRQHDSVRAGVFADETEERGKGAEADMQRRCVVEFDDDR